MRAILKPRLTDVDELQVGVMDQRRGVERPVRFTAPQTLMGEAPQLVIHQRHQAVERLFIPFAPLAE
jgi:hypothetical protein